MRTKVGLWIDHKKAMIVAVTDQGVDLRPILSKVEKQLRRSGDSPVHGTYESQLVPADDSRQNKFTKDISLFYDAVIANIRDAEAILIFGPGVAKDELRKRLAINNLDSRIVGVETVDKMTDRQIATKVRQRFQEKTPKATPGRKPGARPLTRGGRSHGSNIG